jgi:hypothetical protein
LRSFVDDDNDDDDDDNGPLLLPLIIFCCCTLAPDFASSAEAEMIMASRTITVLCFCDEKNGRKRNDEVFGRLTLAHLKQFDKF